jgi:formylglycine-generating enzyme required for sulfatase activity/predicted Ser/Thr protein kinase
MGELHRLGKYEIAEELGRGAFATVYRALDTTLEREVALKVLKPVLMGDEAWVERFRREARALANLRHPHIVAVYEVGEAEGRLFIAMELARGPNLGQAIAERGRIPWDEVLALLRPVCEALDYAHDRGVLHRDLKPANILLDKERGPLLTDFGFARLMGDSSASISLSGGVVGTPAYIAPEVWEEKDITSQTDVYALACVICEMVTGEVLFGGETPAGVMRRHLLEGPRLPETWPEGVPRSLQEVLTKALSRQPGERHKNAGEVVAALREHEPEGKAQEVGVREIAPPVTQTSSRSRGKPGIPGWVWGTIAGGGLVLVSLRIAFGPRLFRVGVDVTEMPTVRSTALPTDAPPAVVPTNTPQPTVVPTFAPGDTWERPADGMVMVYVPAGEFRMGSMDGNSDEQPVHIVTLDGFWIDKTEVTNAQYALCVRAGTCDPPRDSSSFTRDSYYGERAYDDCPVIYASWHDAEDYCGWAGGRLPTEAEWEYAARGPEEYAYPWGNDAPDCAKVNYLDCVGDTAAVGSHSAGASWVGAEDMAGNVWEWVADWYNGSYYGSAPSENPAGPSSGEDKVVRGGSWLHNPTAIRAASRSRFWPDVVGNDFGIRCVRSAELVDLLPMPMPTSTPARTQLPTSPPTSTPEPTDTPTPMPTPTRAQPSVVVGGGATIDLAQIPATFAGAVSESQDAVYTLINDSDARTIVLTMSSNGTSLQCAGLFSGSSLVVPEDERQQFLQSAASTVTRHVTVPSGTHMLKASFINYSDSVCPLTLSYTLTLSP